MVERPADVIQIPVAGTDNFTYLVVCPESGKAMGIDPGAAPDSLLEAVHEHQLALEILANTHGHRDHTAGNQRVLEATGARLAAHPADVAEPDLPLEEGSVLQFGSIEVRVMHTPGHTPGSVVFTTTEAVITGDTLFVTRCGRADLPGSDPEALYGSLGRLARLPKEFLVYPGHDYGPKPSSTIGFELENNPYLQCSDLQSFLRLRMG
ncbi:MAG TPA: MBL fold metallo-hydrolase [Desulfuromonadales bacterium]|nr:MBL fold metallo-hydrolase [Desulfuromonadales bacterium]